MKTTVTRSLLIGAAYLCVATYVAECSCDKRTGAFQVYYTPSSGNAEICAVFLDYCKGDCYTYYEHRPHLTDENYASPDKNCKWSSQYCRILDHNSESAELEYCSPVGGGTSQFDPANPWTVTIDTATSCGCGTTVTREGAAHCPKLFA